MKEARRKIAPGPPGRPLTGHLSHFRRDVLGLILSSTAKYGDVVRFRLVHRPIHLVNHPDHVEHVLHKHAANYDKATASSDKIAGIVGQSLLTSNGQSWKRQRRLIQPAFTQARLGRFEEIMVDATGAMLERWRTWARAGEPFDVAAQMMGLTFTIVGQTLFGADLTADIAAVEQTFTTVIEHTYKRMEHVIDVPQSIPIRANRRFSKAMKTLDAIVYRIIAQRRATGVHGDDLLGMLLAARDDESAGGMTDEEVRNEALTILLAGHETTAIALAWTFYLIAAHPNVEAALREEIATVLGDRPPAAGDLPHLKYATMVFQESMRLYPPIWIMERRAIADDTIGGYHIPADSSVCISPYAMHRRPDFWPDPNRFDPDRFLPAAIAVRPRHAYIPFGLGSRLCLGMHFALMEARIIIPMVIQSFHLARISKRPVAPQPGVTLRLRSELPMRAEISGRAGGDSHSHDPISDS